MDTLRCVMTIFLIQQGCVKVWDIGQSSGKNPISTLECLVSQYDNPVWISASEYVFWVPDHILFSSQPCPILVVHLVLLYK